MENSLTQRQTDIPVLVLHNVDPAWSPTETAAAIDSVEKLHSELSSEGHPVVRVPVTDDNLTRVLRPYNPDDYVVFNWCEELPGTPRSDATVADILEHLNFAYTGSPPDVLRLSWDKVAAKNLMCQNDIPTPDWQVMHDTLGAGHWERFPAIVKPAFEHCSIGITSDAVVMDPQTLKDRVAFVHDTFDQPALVEKFIDGREFHVSLWGNGEISALPPAEMDFSLLGNLKDRLCTYDSKFTPGSIHYEQIELKVPARLDDEQCLALNQIALDAYKVMGCRDYARIDLRMGDGIYYVLDINPNADLSPDTSFVYAAETVGLSYGGVASILINLAAQRHPFFSTRI